jgi:hypothetical protein
MRYSDQTVVRSLVLILLLGAASCTSSTGLRVQIQGPPGQVLTSVTVSIFDPYGLIGKKQITTPVLPGLVTVTGLADNSLQLRVVALATTNSVPLLGGTRVSIVPHMVTTTTVTLGNPLDTDHDGIPDSLDDCPTVPDPTQANRNGTGPGDACRTPVVADLALPANADLAIADLGSSDLASADLALNDLATAPPDLMPGPSLCSSANAIFCEGFESGGTGGWGVLGTVSVDSQHVFRGKYAMHAHQNAVGSGTQTTGVLVSTQPYPTTDIYLRAYAYLPSPAPTGTFTFLRTQLSANGQYSVDLRVDNGHFGTDATRTGVVMGSKQAPPLDRWFCVEWQIHLATTGYTIVNIDGAPVTGLQANNTFDTTNTPNYDWLVVGLDSGPQASGIPARDLWLDEIILDNKPIGCAR